MLANKNSLHYLMSVAKQMSATGHCYSGLVIVAIAATAIKMTNKRFFLIRSINYDFFIFSRFQVK